MTSSNRVEVEIGDYTFYIRRMEPFLAVEVLGDLQTYFLAPFVSTLEALKGNSPKPADNALTSEGVTITLNTEEDKAMVQAAVSALEKFSRQMDGKTLVRLCKMVLRKDYISVKPSDSASDKVVQLGEGQVNMCLADVGDLTNLVIQVLMVNYQKVFTDGLRRIGEALKQRAENRSASLPKS